LKIDVEGATYAVLEGFGERIKDINAVHLEAEHIKYIKARNYMKISLLS
jgi:hypothetical protein